MDDGQIQDQGASLRDRAVVNGAASVSALRASVPSADCRNCDGGGWVCENHADLPWEGTSNRDDACHCGAGMPCGACSLGMASAGFVDRREQAVATWLAELEPSYSGWNDHDEHYDRGWNHAIEWVAEQLRSGKHRPAAQAIEARSDETRSGSAVGERAVGNADAPDSTPSIEGEA
jgi:hypothetical protein